MVDGRAADSVECTHTKLPLYVTTALVGVILRIVNFRRQRDLFVHQIVLQRRKSWNAGVANQALEKQGEPGDECDVKQVVYAVRTTVTCLPRSNSYIVQMQSEGVVRGREGSVFSAVLHHRSTQLSHPIPQAEASRPFHYLIFSYISMHLFYPRHICSSASCPALYSDMSTHCNRQALFYMTKLCYQNLVRAVLVFWKVHGKKPLSTVPWSVLFADSTTCMPH